MSCPVIELAQQLIRRPSLTPKDEGCQEILIARLQAIGFSIERLNFATTKNFWAWRGTGKTLAFAGHTDVVAVGDERQWHHPPFEPTIRNGMLYGRGAADMKGSLAAMVIAAERFIKVQPAHKGRLAFLITSDEEGHATNGTIKVVEALITRGEKLDYCLVGEPSSTKRVGDVIKNGRRGSLTAHLQIYGVQGHVAYPHLALNPIHEALPFLQTLITTQWDHGNEFFPPTTLQLTDLNVLEASSNVIPGKISVQFNLRFSSELTDKLIQERINALLLQHQLNYQIEWALSGQPFLTAKGELVDAAINAVRHYNDITPKLETSGGTSDGRFIALMGGQLIELGPVNATIHKINECVNAAELQLLSRMYQRIISLLMV